MRRSTKFSPAVQERAVRLVLEHRSEHDSQGRRSVRSVPSSGRTAETLRLWVRRHESDHELREDQSTAERDRVKALEREVRELRQANEILRKASAYFAQAELDRRFKP